MFCAVLCVDSRAPMLYNIYRKRGEQHERVNGVCFGVLPVCCVRVCRLWSVAHDNVNYWCRSGIHLHTLNLTN